MREREGPNKKKSSKFKFTCNDVDDVRENKTTALSYIDESIYTHTISVLCVYIYNTTI